MDRAFSASRAMVVGSTRTNNVVRRRVGRGMEKENKGGGRVRGGGWRGGEEKGWLGGNEVLSRAGGERGVETKTGRFDESLPLQLVRSMARMPNSK